MIDMLKVGLKRFVKGFVAGGVANVLLMLGPGIHLTNLAEAKTWFVGIIAGFLVGGLLAIEKMLQQVPPQ